MKQERLRVLQQNVRQATEQYGGREVVSVLIVEAARHLADLIRQVECSSTDTEELSKVFQSSVQRQVEGGTVQ